MKIGIYVAHDDDAIIGVGGTIIKHLKSGDDVYVVIFTDGENSHRIVLGLEENPNPQEVKEKRKEEIRNAMNVLGLKKDGLFFLNQIDGNGNFWKDDADLFNKVLSLTNQEKPDIIYYHYQLDDHVDHKAVNKIVSNIVKKIKTPIQAYQFCVWGGINNPDITLNIENVLNIKKFSLYEMKSQVLKNPPYDGWKNQDRAILTEEEIRKFLKTREAFKKD